MTLNNARRHGGSEAKILDAIRQQQPPSDKSINTAKHMSLATNQIMAANRWTKELDKIKGELVKKTNHVLRVLDEIKRIGIQSELMISTAKEHGIVNVKGVLSALSLPSEPRPAAEEPEQAKKEEKFSPPEARKKKPKQIKAKVPYCLEKCIFNRVGCSKKTGNMHQCGNCTRWFHKKCLKRLHPEKYNMNKAIWAIKVFRCISCKPQLATQLQKLDREKSEHLPSLPKRLAEKRSSNYSPAINLEKLSQQEKKLTLAPRKRRKRGRPKGSDSLKIDRGMLKVHNSAPRKRGRPKGSMRKKNKKRKITTAKSILVKRSNECGEDEATHGNDTRSKTGSALAETPVLSMKESESIEAKKEKNESSIERKSETSNTLMESNAPILANDESPKAELRQLPSLEQPASLPAGLVVPSVEKIQPSIPLPVKTKVKNNIQDNNTTPAATNTPAVAVVGKKDNGGSTHSKDSAGK